MSKTYRRGIKTSKFTPQAGGRRPQIPEVHDSEASHSKDCYLCCSGKKPKRLQWVKPRRRKDKELLQSEVTAAFDTIAAEGEEN